MNTIETEEPRKYRPRKACPKCHTVGRLFHLYSFSRCEVCDTTYTTSTMNEVECSRSPPENETPEELEIRKRKEALESYNENIEYEEEEEKRSPLKGYVRQIRGIRRLRDIPFEEYYDNQIASDETTRVWMKQLIPRMTSTMTDEEWNLKLRRAEKENRERMKQNKVDQNLLNTVKPKSILRNNLGKILCGCTAEDVRQDKFCNTCTLLAKVNEYLMQLFKDTANAMK
jgi:hypothetical protein